MESTSDARFKYHRFKFPIRGGHSYGDGIGAPRSGHTHQGQDLFARCGTPLVAARGGRVQWKAYHSSAGYYLVIDGKKTGRDYAYMHLKKPSPLREGQRVRTGREDRQGRPERQRHRLPPAHGGVDGAGLVRGRALRTVDHQAPEAVGPLELGTRAPRS